MTHPDERDVAVAEAHAPAHALNPAAGDHPVTGDAGELAAARRAAGRSWAQFPYYAYRYGGRGRRFSHSDSGWLVTLCDLPPEAAVAQVHWLGAVLAVRGMPRWLLECHLEILQRELAETRPERRARYGVLAEAAAALRTQRRAAIPQARFEALDAEFAARVDTPWRLRLPRMGAILVAAVADECAGLEAAVRSVAAWAGDAARFPTVWVDAVVATIASARAAAR
jgi:hypothetical protein